VILTVISSNAACLLFVDPRFGAAVTRVVRHLERRHGDGFDRVGQGGLQVGLERRDAVEEAEPEMPGRVESVDARQACDRFFRVMPAEGACTTPRSSGIGPRCRVLRRLGSLRPRCMIWWRSLVEDVGVVFTICPNPALPPD
jgi:hypothetical protein